MTNVPLEQQLTVVKKFVKNKCFAHPEWDNHDLEGKILEDLTRWPPRFLGEVVRRCQYGYADWTKAKMGGTGKGDRPNRTTDYTARTIELHYQLTPTLKVEEVISGDMDVMDWNAELDPDLLRHFSPREKLVLELLVEGYTQEEIAGALGMRKSTLSVIVSRIRPRLAKCLNIST